MEPNTNNTPETEGELKPSIQTHQPVIQPLTPTPPLVAEPVSTTIPVNSPEAPIPHNVAAPAELADNEQPFVPSIATPTVFSGDGGFAPAEMPKPATKKKAWMKPAFAVAGLLIVLGGGGAAAYAGMIMPSKPENVLKSAFAHSIQQQQMTFDGKVNFQSTTEDGFSAKTTFTGATDRQAKTSQANIAITVSGATVSLEARVVDKNIYVKVSDLQTIVSLANSVDPSLGSYVQAVNKEVGDQWIEVDSTLLDQSGLSCVLDSDVAVSKDDLKTLDKLYDTNKPVVIKSHASDTLDGKNVQKYVLSIDDDKAAKVLNGLSGLSSVKALQKCNKNTSQSSTTPIKGDHSTTPITVWIDKGSKEIVQIGTTSTAKDEDKDHIKGDVTVKVGYKKVVTTKPATTKPLLQVMANLQALPGAEDLDLSGLFPGTQTKSQDSKRQTDVASIQTHLEAYFNDKGSYPTLAEMNDAAFRAKNLDGLDEMALQDPEGTSQTLVATPIAKAVAYQPTTKGAACTVSAKCDAYTLTATLSDGTTYKKESLN